MWLEAMPVACAIAGLRDRRPCLLRDGAGDTDQVQGDQRHLHAA